MKKTRRSRVRRYRRRRGLTASELAQKMGVYPSTVSRWESGERLPNVIVGQQIAEALGTTVAKLWPVALRAR